MAQLIPANPELDTREITPRNGYKFTKAEVWERAEQYIGSESIGHMYPDDGSQILFFDQENRGQVNQRVCKLLNILPTGELKKVMVANGKSIDQDWLPADDAAPAYQIFGNALLISVDEIEVPISTKRKILLLAMALSWIPFVVLAGLIGQFVTIKLFLPGLIAEGACVVAWLVVWRFQFRSYRRRYLDSQEAKNEKRS